MTLKPGDIRYSPVMKADVIILDVFGRKRPDGTIHLGYDFKRLNSPIGAELFGITSGLTECPPFNSKGGYETHIVKNANKWIYSHQDKRLTSNKQQIKAGELVGICGNTGHVVPPPTASNPNRSTHVHAEKRIWSGKQWIAVDGANQLFINKQETMPERAIQAIMVVNGAPELINQEGEKAGDFAGSFATIKFDRQRISKNWAGTAAGLEYRAIQAPGKPIRWVHDNDIDHTKDVWGFDDAAEKLQDIDNIIHKK